MQKFIMVLTAIAFWQVSPALSDDAAIVAEFEAARDTLNQAFENQDGAAIARMVTADHLGVTSLAGVQTTAEQIETIDDWNARYFDYSTPNVSVLAPDVVQITYENSYEGDYAGTPFPARVFVSQIWLKQDGTWKQQLYQETPIEAK